jgi:prolyl-tRNA synthetase
MIKVRAAYKNFFNNLGLLYKEAVADSGAIGGDKSHEYHLLSHLGEDTILNCGECGYCSNIESAHSLIVPNRHVRSSDKFENESVITEHFKEMSSLFASNVSVTMGIVEKKDCNLLLGIVTPKGWDINPVKVSKLFLNHKFRILSKNTSIDHLEINETLLLVDSQVQYLKNLNFSPTIKLQTGDFIQSREGDLCKTCFSKSKQSELKAITAIEVGHAFFLGDKYSSPLNATYTCKNGKEKTASMGCFGLGVSRLISAIAEVSHDSHGIIWPACIAPADICVILVPSKSPDENSKLNDTCHHVLSKMNEKYNRVLFDDRPLSFPQKIKDALLIGYPLTIVVGKSFLSTGTLEVFDRYKPDAPKFKLIEEL